MAAANNAFWCSAVSRAHGLTDEWRRDYWRQADKSLPLYPNLITLSLDGRELQTAAIEQGARSGLEHWSVKDSFNAIDLTSLGFRVLFRAEWFFGDMRMGPIGQAGACHRAESHEELRAWESAWGEKPPDWPYGDRVFPASLLEDDRVAFLFSLDDGEITGGLVANYGAECIGISNAFARGSWNESMTACLHGAAAMWPDKPLVGYAGTAELGALEGLGFERLTPCRIWVL
jgi:hypothetical protein